MAAATDSIDLTGKLLVAMPDMGDPRFAKSVIYVCTHSDEGAMGLIVNKPAEDLKFRDLLKQLNIAPAAGLRPIRVHVGGPVEFGRGFVLHSSEYSQPRATLSVEGGFAMTATLDILEDIAAGNGPERSMLAMGYSGWGPGQLEGELAQNGWLIADAGEEIVFGQANEHKWQAALKSMGIDPLLLSGSGGTA